MAASTETREHVQTSNACEKKPQNRSNVHVGDAATSSNVCMYIGVVRFAGYPMHLKGRARDVFAVSSIATRETGRDLIIVIGKRFRTAQPCECMRQQN